MNDERAMRSFIVHPSSFIVLLTLLVCTSALGGETAPPNTPGMQIMLHACVQCHDFRWITSQNKTEAAWRRTINEMIWRGAPLMPGEADVLTRFLASGTLQAESGKRANDEFVKAL